MRDGGGMKEHPYTHLLNILDDVIRVERQFIIALWGERHSESR